jgi:hypothetical protein
MKRLEVSGIYVVRRKRVNAKISFSIIAFDVRLVFCGRDHKNMWRRWQQQQLIRNFGFSKSTGKRDR